MIEMIENTPPPFESSDDDDKTIVDVEEGEEDGVDDSKLGNKIDSKKKSA